MDDLGYSYMSAWHILTYTTKGACLPSNIIVCRTLHVRILYTHMATVKAHEVAIKDDKGFQI